MQIPLKLSYVLSSLLNISIIIERQTKSARRYKSDNYALFLKHNIPRERSFLMSNFYNFLFALLPVFVNCGRKGLSLYFVEYTTSHFSSPAASDFSIFKSTSFPKNVLIIFWSLFMSASQSSLLVFSTPSGHLDCLK